MTKLPDGYYEVEKTKINLEFYYDFLDYYLSREDFQILEMDTDSNYLRIAAESVEDLIKPELKEQFER